MKPQISYIYASKNLNRIFISGKVQHKNNEDNTSTVKYTPKTHGIYIFTVRFDGDQIPGSPFNVNIKEKIML